MPHYANTLLHTHLCVPSHMYLVPYCTHTLHPTGDTSVPCCICTPNLTACTPHTLLHRLTMSHCMCILHPIPGGHCTPLHTHPCAPFSPTPCPIVYTPHILLLVYLIPIESTSLCPTTRAPSAPLHTPPTPHSMQTSYPLHTHTPHAPRHMHPAPHCICTSLPLHKHSCAPLMCITLPH